MRHKDKDWNLPDQPQTWEQVVVAVLMDIRDELRVLNCPNFLAIPEWLRQTAINTKKKKRHTKAR